MRKLFRALDHAGWIVAFVALCAAYGYQVAEAARQSAARHAAATAPPPQHTPPNTDAGPWICPILGQCGPPGMPGLGRW